MADGHQNVRPKRDEKVERRAVSATLTEQLCDFVKQGRQQLRPRLDIEKKTLSVHSGFPSLRKCATMGSPGFSVIELLVVVGIIFVFAVVTVPTLMTNIYSIRLRYSAVNLSEVLQSARMEAVRRNSFFSVQYVPGSSITGTPAMEQVVDKTSAVVTSIPPTVLGSNVSVFFGTGSGAPGETNLVTSLNFTPAASTAGLPSFNARGLPCIPVAGNTCPVTVGQGFIFFMSGMSDAAQTLAWTAVAVTPSGRCQIFAYDGGTWTQQ